MERIAGRPGHFPFYFARENHRVFVSYLDL